MTSRNKKPLGQKGKGVCKFPIKQRSVANMVTQKEMTEEKKVNCKGHAESVYNKRFDDTDYDDPITMLRKEIQDWRINEILTARTEERLSGTPSEPRTYSYVASGETTKRQQSPNDPPKSCRTFVDIVAVTKERDTLEYLDLRKEPVPRSSAFCHSKMHSRSACDCYCKILTPRTCRKNEIQSERGRARLLTSKRSISKADAIRSARKIPSTSATLVDEDQADSKRSTVTLPISPILSPETSAALEDVERLVKDAQIQIKGIGMVANSNRAPKNFNTYLDEVTLDDEKDQLLYVRERVAQKFQESNGWIDANYVDPATREASKEGKPPIRLKKTTDFSAPKFKTSKDFYKEFSSYQALFGKQNPELATRAATNEIEKEKRDPNDFSCLEPGRAEKVGTFSVQAGPSVNIERSLIAQNLENIRISPDPFFVQESANVGTYTICHDHRNGGSSGPKEKFMKIPDEPRSVENNARSIGNAQGRKNSKQLNGAEKLVDSTPNSDPKTSEGTKDDLPENKTEDSGKLEEKTPENKKSLDSESVDPENEKRSKPEEDLAQLSEAVREERREKVTSEARNDQATKQVRFEAEFMKKTEHPVETREEEISMLDLKIFEGTELNGRNVQETKGYPSTSNRIVEEYNQTQPIEDKREKRLKGTSEKDELQRNERYRIVEERFANILKKYRIEKEAAPTNERLVSSSSTNSSAEDLEEPEDPDDLYRPSIDDLDNVLTAYDKIINDVSLSTRTIEKFLSRPELEEYHAQEANAAARDRPSISREPLSTVNAYQTKRLDYSSESSDKIARHVDAKKSCSLRAGDESPNLTASSGDPLSSSTDIRSVNDDRPLQEIFKSSVESIADETTRFRPGLTSTQEIKRTSSQKGEHNYTTLYDLVYNDILKRGFPKSGDTKNMAERLIGCALEEERRFIEEKIKTASNVNCVESLLEHLQNDPPTSRAQNLELLISENATVNDTASADLHVAETARARSKSEEGKLEIEGFPKDEKEDASRGSNRQDIIVESVFNSKSQSSTSSKEKNSERSSANETSKIYSNIESSQEKKTRSKATIDGANFNGNDHAIPQNEAQLKTEQNDDDSRKSPANEPIENSETEIIKTMENKATHHSNNNLDVKNVAVEAIASFSKNTIPEVKSDESVGLQLAQDKAGVPAQSISNVIHVSSSDSLHDCASLESSPKNVSKTSSNKANPKREFNEIEQLPQTCNPLNGEPIEITNRRGLYHGNVIEKEKVLADLYEDVHRKLLFSTLDTNYSNAVDQDYRTSNPSSVKLNKIEELSSDTSRSEGELCMPSSGSYSLGEVKVLSTDACENSVTIFVTKEMLTSWNESSKSLIQSMGEI